VTLQQCPMSTQCYVLDRMDCKGRDFRECYLFMMSVAELLSRQGTVRYTFARYIMKRSTTISNHPRTNIFEPWHWPYDLKKAVAKYVEDKYGELDTHEECLPS
jgi:hypothetical protein